jgi:hypothetical protein
MQMYMNSHYYYRNIQKLVYLKLAKQYKKKEETLSKKNEDIS